MSKRQFAPLGPEGDDPAYAHLPKLKGIVFDVDGTLCEPQNYMFGQMRSALGIDKSTDILTHIYSLPTSADQVTAMSKVQQIESDAMVLQRPQPGLLTLMEYLDSHNLPKALCTRNFDAPVLHLREKFMKGVDFEPVVTREFRPPKPDPAGLLHIAKEWGMEHGGEMIMVGDSIDDMTAGYHSGAATVLLVNEVNAHLADHEFTDLTIKRLDELVDHLKSGFIGRHKSVSASPSLGRN